MRDKEYEAAMIWDLERFPHRGGSRVPIQLAKKPLEKPLEMQI